jgi:hypothetical protein
VGVEHEFNSSFSPSGSLWHDVALLFDHQASWRHGGTVSGTIWHSVHLFITHTGTCFLSRRECRKAGYGLVNVMFGMVGICHMVTTSHTASQTWQCQVSCIFSSGLYCLCILYSGPCRSYHALCTDIFIRTCIRPISWWSTSECAGNYEGSRFRAWAGFSAAPSACWPTVDMVYDQEFICSGTCHGLLICFYYLSAFICCSSNVDPTLGGTLGVLVQSDVDWFLHRRHSTKWSILT